MEYKRTRVSSRHRMPLELYKQHYNLVLIACLWKCMMLDATIDDQTEK